MISGNHAKWKFTHSNGRTRQFNGSGLFVDIILEYTEELLTTDCDMIVLEFEGNVFRRLSLVDGLRAGSFRVCASGQRIVHVLYERVRENSPESGNNVIGTYEPVF